MSNELISINHSFTATLHDIRFALRQLRKHLPFTVTAILILALGVGSSTAVFCVLYQTVLEPLPYPEPQRLAFVHTVFPKRQVPLTGVSALDCSQVAHHREIFPQAGIFFWNDLVLTGLGDARHIDVVNASASLFAALGMQPQLGFLIACINVSGLLLIRATA
jgi:putative ABC transport system permease protein